MKQPTHVKFLNDHIGVAKQTFKKSDVYKILNFTSNDRARGTVTARFSCSGKGFVADTYHLDFRTTNNICYDKSTGYPIAKLYTPRKKSAEKLEPKSCMNCTFKVEKPSGSSYGGYQNTSPVCMNYEQAEIRWEFNENTGPKPIIEPKSLTPGSRICNSYRRDK